MKDTNNLYPEYMNENKDFETLTNLIIFMFGNHLHYNTMYENITHSEEAAFTMMDMIRDTVNNPNDVAICLGVLIKEELIRWQGVKRMRKTTEYNTPVVVLDPYFTITIHGIIEYWNKYGKRVRK